MTGGAAPSALRPPSADPRAAPLAALVAQLGQSEWRAPEAIAAAQRRQLAMLAAWCARYSPQFRGRLDAAGLGPEELATPGGLTRLEPMGRREVQASDRLHCREIPASHMPLGETRTSGSTGEPVRIVRTSVSQLDWLMMTIRDHLWHARDFGGRLTAIRANVPARTERPDWGLPVNLLFESGPSLTLPITLDAAELVRILVDFGTTSLIAYPSTLAAIIGELERSGARLGGLKELRTVGETLPPATRDAALHVLGLPIADTYTSQEIGYMALQCPDSGLYHVMAETVIVEVIDAAGAPCGEGETGRVVVTDLRNFATPLVRYDIGDYAEPGPPCPCGRGLPTLSRIRGRERNLLRLPDGRRFWPLLGGHYFRDIAPVRQFQGVQHDLDHIEVRLVCETSLTPDQEDRLRKLVQKSLGHPFNVDFTYFRDRIPVGPNGKFEEFICRLDPP